MIDQITLPKINQREFLRRLRERKLEDIPVINRIEAIFRQKRGYVFKLPRPGESVILLLSGGLDSVTCWGILMKEYGLQVYPLSFDRGEKRANREKESVEYFSRFYAKRFPKLYHEPKRINLGFNDFSIPIDQAPEHLHPELIMEKFEGKSWLTGINLSFGSFLLLPVYAKLYAEYLNHTQFVHARTIFCSVTLSDGLIVPHQTFTSLRSIMFNLCAATGDYSWQFSSAIFEKETGLYFDKADLVRWAAQYKIPLEKTWSCYHSTKYQCGGSDCLTCVARRKAFLRAGITDQTIYLSVEEQSLKSYFRHLQNKISGKFRSFIK